MQQPDKLPHASMVDGEIKRRHLESGWIGNVLMDYDNLRNPGKSSCVFSLRFRTGDAVVFRNTSINATSRDVYLPYHVPKIWERLGSCG